MVVFFLLLLSAVGCKPSSINSTGPGTGVVTGATSGITVSANPTSISTFGITSISATVRDAAGNLVPDGTLVSFVLSTGTLGTLSSPTATTTGGVAQVTFTAGGSTGTVTATVTAAGVTGFGSASITITASATSALSLTASPNSVFVGGTSTITAHVVDGSGNPVANNTVVSFTFPVPSDALKASLTSNSALTANGNATVTLTAISNVNTTVQVTATSGAKTSTITITITGGLAGGSITVAASPTSIVANGVSTSALTATLLDVSNNPVVGATVTFTQSGGASLSSATAVTNASGIATVTLTAGLVPATVAVTAAALSLPPASTTVSLVAVSGNGTMTVVPNPVSIITNGTAVVTATATDTFGAPIAGATVNFTLNMGVATLSAPTAVTNGAGVATVNLTAGNIPANNVVITATIAAPFLSGTGNLTIISAPPSSVTVAVNPTSITVLGTSTITATVMDVNGNPVPDGTGVTFSTTPALTFGTLSNSVSSTANSNGQATTTFIASNTAGTVTVMATAGSVSSTVTLTIVPAATGSIQFVSATPQVIGIRSSGQTETSIVKFQVKDINGNPATDGTAVSFSLIGPGGGEYVGAADLTPNSATGSTVGGFATVILSSGTVAGPCTVIASTSINSGNQTNETSALDNVVTTIPVASTAGFPVSGRIKIDSELIDYTGTTGASFTGCTRGTVGTSAAAHLSNAQVFGQNTISSSATQVSIGGGVPSASHWNLATSKFNLQGLKFSGLDATISAYIADRFGNYNILTGTALSFYTEGGAIDTQGITDSAGFTSVVFRTQIPNPLDVKNTTTGDLDNADFSPYFVGNEPWYPSGTLNANPRDGWVTVLATTLGEEAFLDENGNGMFTRSYAVSNCPPGYTCECDGGTPNAYVGCVTSQQNGAAISASICANATTSCFTAFGGGPTSKRSEGFLDQGEPFYDKNDNGKRDDGSVSGYPFEEFIDGNGNFSYDGPNGIWDGPDCQTTGCQKSKMIWKDIRLVFTGDAVFYPRQDLNNCYDTGNGCTGTFALGDFTVAPASITKGTTGSFSVIVGDQNLNRLAPGTRIVASASEGALTGISSVTLADGLSRGPTVLNFGVQIDVASQKSSTTVTVTVTTPDTIVTPTALVVPLI